MFGAKKAHTEFRKENMYGKKDNQETSKGKVVFKETSDEYIETKPEALNAIDITKKWKVSYCWKTQSSYT